MVAIAAAATIIEGSDGATNVIMEHPGRLLHSLCQQLGTTTIRIAQSHSVCHRVSAVPCGCCICARAFNHSPVWCVGDVFDGVGATDRHGARPP
eukprot:2010704-Prymnesium_polylepis.2